MEISVKTLPHDKQRYNTCGDYWFNDGLIHIRVSDMKNEDYAFLVAIHEQIEAYLTQKRGIDEKEITLFDTSYQGEGEPGDAKDAPYRKEHFFATTIERLIAAELNVDWNEYEKTNMSIGE